MQLLLLCGARIIPGYVAPSTLLRVRAIASMSEKREKLPAPLGNDHILFSWQNADLRLAPLFADCACMRGVCVFIQADAIGGEQKQDLLAQSRAVLTDTSREYKKIETSQ